MEDFLRSCNELTSEQIEHTLQRGLGFEIVIHSKGRTQVLVELHDDFNSYRAGPLPRALAIREVLQKAYRCSVDSDAIYRAITQLAAATAPLAV